MDLKILEIENKITQLCEAGNIDELKEYINETQYPDLAFNNNLLFHIGIESGNIELLNYLIKTDPIIEITLNYEDALRKALIYNKLDSMKFLLDLNPLLTMVYNTNTASLICAIAIGNNEMKEHLIKISPNIINSLAYNYLILFCDAWTNTCYLSDLDLFKKILKLNPGNKYELLNIIGIDEDIISIILKYHTVRYKITNESNLKQICELRHYLICL